jgi:ribosomal protein S18 acetylase RimI-like enzyme
MTELEESNRQALGAWIRFANGFESGIVEQMDGVTAAFARTTLPFLNLIALNRPVSGIADLSRRVESAVEFAHRQGAAYFITVCEDWIPAMIRDSLEQVMADAGLVPVMPWTGMAANELAGPTRHPLELEIRPADGDHTRVAIMDLNCLSYDMPLEMGRGSRGDDRLWHDLFGSVGYVGQTPVSTATVMPIEGRLYVAMVATHPEYRRRGYAEACMREALSRAEAATGFRRTILHATNAGHPVYRRMGYHDTSRFTLFAEPH